MNNYVELRKRFWEFELKNRLFEIKDKNGMPLWDIIRPVVYSQMLGSYEGLGKSIVRINSCQRLASLFNFVNYFLTHWNKKYLFFICSRNFDGRDYFDKIADGIIGSLNPNDLYIIESFGTERQKNYKYKRATPPLVGYVSRFLRITFDSKPIMDMLRDSFSDYTIKETSLQSSYKVFYSQYYFYKFLFKVKAVKKCFVVQNQFQKGLFAAATALNIPVFEFQHGEMTANHPAYSYPNSVNLIGKIYIPKVLFTFGKFWMSDCFFPGVEIRPIGNDYYSVEKDTQEYERYGVLVVSSKIHGDYLKELVKDILDNKQGEKMHFWYKLHPNEEDWYDTYVEFFKNYSNVEVVRGTQMIAELIKKSLFILVIESTAEFEALTLGTKVIIYKRGDYDYIDSLFDEKDVYQIDNDKEFLEVYNKYKEEKVHDYGTYFFQPFDKRILESYL